MTLEKVTPKVLLARLRAFSGGTGEDAHALWVVRHDGHPWLLSVYWGFRLSPLAEVGASNLWRICNLDFEPMKFSADLAITKEDGLLPKTVDTLAARAKEDRGEPIVPRALGESALILETFDEERLTMWRRSDGGWSTFRADFHQIVRDFGLEGSWTQGEDESLASCWDEWGDLVGLLQPVKNNGGRMFRDPDLPPTLFQVD
jgi:hypothetical protein